MLLPGQFLYRWTGILHHPLRAFRYVAMQVKSFWNRKFHYNLAFHWCETQLSDGFYNPFIPQQYNAGFLKIRFTQFSIWWFIAIFWTERAMYTHWGHPTPLYRIQSLQSLGGWTLLVVSIWCKYPPLISVLVQAYNINIWCLRYARTTLGKVVLPYCNVFASTKFIVKFY